MDLKETSAMTEASGLTEDQLGAERALAARLSAEAEASRRPSHSQDAAMRWADQLREITLKAPLQSVFVAFLLGIWVARRR